MEVMQDEPGAIRVLVDDSSRETPTCCLF